MAIIWQDCHDGHPPSDTQSTPTDKSVYFLSFVYIQSSLVSEIVVVVNLSRPSMHPVSVHLVLFIHLFNSGCEAHTTTKYALPIDSRPVSYTHLTLPTILRV